MRSLLGKRYKIKKARDKNGEPKISNSWIECMKLSINENTNPPAMLGRME